MAKKARSGTSKAPAMAAPKRGTAASEAAFKRAAESAAKSR
jgi:hypothetical protein